jgi:hypothetical protein
MVINGRRFMTERKMPLTAATREGSSGRGSQVLHALVYRNILFEIIPGDCLLLFFPDLGTKSGEFFNHPFITSLQMVDPRYLGSSGCGKTGDDKR